MKARFSISLVVLAIALIVLIGQQKEEPQILVTTTERINRAGYISESYDIDTIDGYGLTIFRIRNRTDNDRNINNGTKAAPVVFLMHGLASSSDTWVIEGLKNPLAYDLVNQGYDVWLGNSRGNIYSKRHIRLSPDDKEYWNFSLHEIGAIDLPCIIDFILNHTNKSDLHYVGYSQGTATGMILLAMHPKYNEKIKTMHMLGPCIYMVHGKSFTQYFAGFLGIHTPVHPYIGNTELFSSKLLRQLLWLDKCRSKEANAKICSFILYLLFGGYSADLDKSLLPDIFNSHPTSASMRQLLHFMQFHHTKEFIQYNHGHEGNMRRYNQSSAPLYNLTNVNPRFPIQFFYSDYDEYMAREDLEMLRNQLGNKMIIHFIDRKYYAHVDFVWGSNNKEIIHQPILDMMNKAENLIREQTSQRS
ncbi:lipase 3-like [Haematobia irritans]|uniref:lipase 3-like n=1 Tax=Haematobia irritans TaxID=7368 RepID=UPI003F507005